MGRIKERSFVLNDGSLGNMIGRNQIIFFKPTIIVFISTTDTEPFAALIDDLYFGALKKPRPALIGGMKLILIANVQLSCGRHVIILRGCERVMAGFLNRL